MYVDWDRDCLLYTSLEQEMLKMYDLMGEADEEQMNKLLEETAEIQTILENSGFYTCLLYTSRCV